MLGYVADMPYIVLALISMALGLVSQAYIKSTYKKWSGVPSGLQGTGADVARRMLEGNGATDVGITQVAGYLTDYYDPRDNRLHLSEANYGQGSVASVAVACHEAGHAIQHAQGYMPVKIRTSLVPVVNFTSKAWILLFIAGIYLNLLGLAQVALALFGFSVLFHLVTLPVEIDASRRAVAYLGSVSQIDQQGAKAVLRAAAMTYVASALVSVLQFLYYAGAVSRRR